MKEKREREVSGDYRRQRTAVLLPFSLLPSKGNGGGGVIRSRGIISVVIG